MVDQNEKKMPHVAATQLMQQSQGLPTGAAAPTASSGIHAEQPLSHAGQLLPPGTPSLAASTQTQTPQLQCPPTSQPTQLQATPQQAAPLAAPQQPPAQPPSSHQSYAQHPFGPQAGAALGSFYDVTYGGKASPWLVRLFGAGFCLLGLGLLALNAFLMATHESFYPKTLILACPAVWAGFWLAVFGKPTQPGSLEQPVWWMLGMYGGLLLALIVGVVAAFGLTDWG